MIAIYPYYVKLVQEHQTTVLFNLLQLNGLITSWEIQLDHIITVNKTLVE